MMRAAGVAQTRCGKKIMRARVKMMRMWVACGRFGCDWEFALRCSIFALSLLVVILGLFFLLSLSCRISCASSY